jgi:hypothetical protein
MNYAELIQAYFQRSGALQWYWTVYIFVIGGILAFSTFRQRPEIITTILVSALYIGFAYKNAGAIEATAEEREAILSVIKSYPATGPRADEVERLRTALEPTLVPYDIRGALHFHIACDLLTLAAVWAKEWHRRKNQAAQATAAA